MTTWASVEKKLTPTQSKVIGLLHGIDSGEPMRPCEIAAELGKSPKAVDNAIRSATARMTEAAPGGRWRRTCLRCDRIDPWWSPDFGVRFCPRCRDREPERCGMVGRVFAGEGRDIMLGRATECR